MPSQLVATTNIDVATGHPIETFLDKENGTAHVDDITPTWDAAGQITSSKDVQDGADTDLQCSTYDTLGQLTTAWTDTAGTTTAAAPSVPNIGGCASQTPSAATVGGPAPYWQSYAYDASGDRSSETDHNLAGNAAADVVHTYGYPTVTGTTGGPDQLGTVTAKVNGTTTGTDSYVYNVDGSVHSRTLASGANESFTYDTAGRTASVTDATTGNSAAYRYDADSNLLMERDTTAGTTTTTLYLPGEHITVNTGSQAVSGLRYYATGTITTIRSSSEALTYEYGSSHGTQTVAVDAATLAVNRRYYTPYGAVRGTTPTSWADNLGFLDKPADTGIGLDVVGARLYDPNAGRFAQHDPVNQTTDAAQLNGYGYASQDPVDFADPTGTRTCVDACGSEADQMLSKIQREQTYQADMQALQDLENQAENQALDDCTRNSCVSRTIQLYNNSSFAVQAAFQLQNQQLVGEEVTAGWNAQFAQDGAAAAQKDAAASSMGGCAGVFSSLCNAFTGIKNQAKAALKLAWNNISAGGTACYFICVGLTTGGRHDLNVSVGALGWGYWSAGASASDKSDTGPWGFGVMAGDGGVFGGVVGGIRTHRRSDDSPQIWAGPTGGFGSEGFGGFAGISYTWHLDFGHGTNTLNKQHGCVVVHGTCA
jgi:RHS repeat-associated protein